MSLREQNTIRKEQKDKMTCRLKFDDGINKTESNGYKVEVISDSVIYARESKDHL